MGFTHHSRRAVRLVELTSVAIGGVLLSGCYAAHGRSAPSDAGPSEDAGVVLPAMLCQPGATLDYAVDCPPRLDAFRVFRPFNGRNFLADDGEPFDYCFCALACGPGDCPAYPGTREPMECRLAVESLTSWGMCFRPCDHDGDCPAGSICAPLGDHLARPWHIDGACALAEPAAP